MPRSLGRALSVILALVSTLSSVLLHPSVTAEALSSTTTTVTSPEASAVVAYGVNVTFVATVTSAGTPVPAGTVVFYDTVGGIPAELGRGDLSPAGTATYVTGNLAIGSHTVYATYLGGGSLSGSTSDSRVLNVKWGTSTSITTVAPEVSLDGQNYVVSYSVSGGPKDGRYPSGSVTVTDGSRSCSATVAAGRCTLSSSGAGNKSLTASYGGDSYFAPSASDGTPHLVKWRTSTEIISVSSSTTVVGQLYTVNYSITSTGGTPKGDVAVSDGESSCSGTVASGSCSLASMSAGDGKPITVQYKGDTSFGPSTSPSGTTHNVTQASTTTTVTSSAPAVIVGHSVQFTAIVQAKAPGSGTPTGYVQFKIDGVNFGVPVRLDGGTAVSASTSTLSGGSPKTYSVAAVYVGDSNYKTSTGTTSQQVYNRGTLAVVSDLDAYLVEGVVHVQWQTTSEMGTVGFHLYRQDAATGEFVQVNRDLVPGSFNSRTGAIYRIADPGARAGDTLVYRLIEVEHDGNRRLNGPYLVTVGLARPEPTATRTATSMAVQPGAANVEDSNVRRAEHDGAGQTPDEVAPLHPIAQVLSMVGNWIRSVVRL